MTMLGRAARSGYTTAMETSRKTMFPQRLIDGYRTFLGDHFARERGRYEALAEQGQNPEILVIGCCDSRVSPEVIFDASPGELLIVRNVANLVPPFETGGAFHGT